MTNLNSYITQMTTKLYISHGSVEKTNIDKSVNFIKSNLKNYFGQQISEIIEFGSYTRGTIIPRKYDLASDVDIMVVFNTGLYTQKQPIAYRNALQSFANTKYPNSISKKDLPSVMLELTKLKFDLVPAVIYSNFLGSSIYIPKSNSDWQVTDPNGFNQELTEANTKYGSIVKPIIRLLKYWNHKNNYPYDSYKLEQVISKMNFSGDTIERGFYYAVDNLPTTWETEYTKQKVKTLRNNKNWILEYLKRDDIVNAKKSFHRIVP